MYVFTWLFAVSWAGSVPPSAAVSDQPSPFPRALQLSIVQRVTPSLPHHPLQAHSGNVVGSCLILLSSVAVLP